MHATQRPSEPASGHALWAKLSRYIIGPGDAALPFAARLARENGWTRPHADRVIEEYRRFCFLAATGDRRATPSDAVDQAWHLHLTYTHDYWERFCPEVLGRLLHHDPAAGGETEGHRFCAQYADTLSRYEQAFGAAPPADLWPAAARRLRDDPRARRVHPRDAFIIPRRIGIAAVLILGAIVGALALT